MSRRVTKWRPPASAEQEIRRWPVLGIATVLAVLSAVAWMASGGLVFFDVRPELEPEIAEIFEEAAEEGTYAYDAASEESNMTDGELFGGSYVMSTTERRRNAPPEGLALVPDGRECARFVREMAELRDHLGFCEQADR